MSAPQGNNPDHPWVQPIIVAKTGTHTDTVRCAAQASVAVWSMNHDGSPFGLDNYEHWLAGPFTKTVRRASIAQMSNLITWADGQHIPCADVSLNDSAALAFPPMRYADMPKQIAKFQVSGTDFPFVEAPFTEPDGPVSVSVNSALSTGKAAAAAAHALWAWMLPLEHSGERSASDLMDRWQTAGFPLYLDFLSEGSLYELSGPPDVLPIIDAGLTEVAPQTLTAVYRPRDWTTPHQEIP